MSETLYNPSYYDSLINYIDYHLKDSPNSLVLIGTKTLYYGLGGGYFEFSKFLEKYNKNKQGMKFKLEIL